MPNVEVKIERTTIQEKRIDQMKPGMYFMLRTNSSVVYTLRPGLSYQGRPTEYIEATSVSTGYKEYFHPALPVIQMRLKAATFEEL